MGTWAVLVSVGRPLAGGCPVLSRRRVATSASVEFRCERACAWVGQVLAPARLLLSRRGSGLRAAVGWVGSTGSIRNRRRWRLYCGSSIAPGSQQGPLPVDITLLSAPVGGRSPGWRASRPGGKTQVACVAKWVVLRATGVGDGLARGR